MGYYTERHGLRAPVERTETITYEMYALIFDCCGRYFENIAWKYPEECPDGNGCCRFCQRPVRSADTDTE